MKKLTIFLGLTVVLSSCQQVIPITHQATNTVKPTFLTTNTGTPPKQDNNYDYDPAHPVKTVDEAVNIIISRLSQDDINYLKNSTKADRYMLHFGLGMGIRNSFGLWKGNEALLKDACGGKICHPDDASSVIISKLLERLKSAK